MPKIQRESGRIYLRICKRMKRSCMLSATSLTSSKRTNVEYSHAVIDKYLQALKDAPVTQKILARGVNEGNTRKLVGQS